MEIVSHFRLPLSPDEAWDAFLDFGRIAHAMPGARLDEVDGDLMKGSITVRLGPMRLEYVGTARVDGGDPKRRELGIEAKGAETRGSGSAIALITTRLSPVEDGTAVEVRADIDVVGRPAQMGGSLIQDVAQRLTDEFAERLREELTGVTSRDTSEGLDLVQMAKGTPAGYVAVATAVFVVIWILWRILS